MSYLYQTHLFRETASVVPIPADNTANLADFEDDHKSTALFIDELALAETTFQIDLTYPDFHDLITGEIEWSDVKYIETPTSYRVLLLSDIPL